MSKLVFFSAVIFLLSGAEAQQWSYQGSSMCYSYSPGSVQCYSSGVIQQYANAERNFEAQFEAGRQIGEGVGTLVGSLLQRWSEHRQKVNAERSDLREQIRTYHDATLQLQDELIAQETAIERATSRLATLVPAERAFYQGWAEHSRKAIAVFHKYKDESPKNTEIILGARNLKFLREQAKRYREHYETMYNAASRGYVATTMMEGLVGFYESQPFMPPATQ